MSEEEKLGGYVVFDMTFVELGAPPFKTAPNAGQNLSLQAEELKQQIIVALSPSVRLPYIRPPSLVPSQIAGGVPFVP
jgi:hypothetical protein